jgi:rubredoxin
MRCKLCDYDDALPSAYLDHDYPEGTRVIFSAILNNFYCNVCLNSIRRNRRLYKRDAASKNKTDQKR